MLTSRAWADAPPEQDVVRTGDLMASRLNWRRANMRAWVGGGDDYESGSSRLAEVVVPDTALLTWLPYLVPNALREAGLGLGIQRWKVTLRIVLPAARAGILTGVMVAVARVAGETAPLLFTALGNRFWHQGLDQPIAALPLLCRGSALRFLMTRLYDWLHQVEGALVKPKDPLEYLRKLRFHRHVAGPESYGLG